jgi:hypothetical protein
LSSPPLYVAETKYYTEAAIPVKRQFAPVWVIAASLLPFNAGKTN